MNSGNLSQRRKFREARSCSLVVLVQTTLWRVLLCKLVIWSERKPDNGALFVFCFTNWTKFSARTNGEEEEEQFFKTADKSILFLYSDACLRCEGFSTQRAHFEILLSDLTSFERSIINNFAWVFPNESKHFPHFTCSYHAAYFIRLEILPSTWKILADEMKAEMNVAESGSRYVCASILPFSSKLLLIDGSHFKRFFSAPSDWLIAVDL